MIQQLELQLDKALYKAVVKHENKIIEDVYIVEQSKEDVSVKLRKELDLEGFEDSKIISIYKLGYLFR